MPIPSRRAALLALAACLPLSALHAEEPPRYNQVGLHAEVSEEVAHDRMRLVLFSEAQHADPAQLAAQTTERLNRAVQRTRFSDGTEVVVNFGETPYDAAVGGKVFRLPQNGKVLDAAFHLADKARKRQRRFFANHLKLRFVEHFFCIFYIMIMLFVSFFR